MWWLLVGVVVILLGVLGVLPSFDFLGAGFESLAAGAPFYISTMLLLILGVLALRVRRLASGTAGLTAVALLGLWVVLTVVMVGLYVARTIAVSSEHETSTISAGHTVQAQVVVSEISDSRYDLASDGQGGYRQKAVLSNIRFKDATNTQGHGDAVNPFYAPSASSPPPDVVLPDTMTVLLSAYPSSLPDKAKLTNDLSQLNDITPRSQLTMTVRITPITQDKVAGFDGYRWLRTRHIHAYAQVISIDSDIQSMAGGWLQRYRQTLRTHFLRNWQTLSAHERSARAVTLSLLTGDRALIDKPTRELYQLAGILHLIAISGTHVVFLALMLSRLGLAIMDKWGYRHYHHISRGTLHMGIVLVSALIYALFTGFDVPAVRTVYMLFACLMAKRLGLSVSPLTVLAAVALGMIWLDPYVLWQAGFWLSFMAVALLMRYDGQDEMAMSTGGGLFGLIKLQSWLFVTLLPISIVLFGKVSLWGLVVNLFAVGLFGIVIVPMNLLAGVIFPIMPALADVLWSVSAAILGLLHSLLHLLSRIGDDVWLYHTLGLAAVALMGLAVFAFVVPVLSRRYVAVPLVAWLFVMTTSTPLTGVQMVNLSADISRDDGLQALLVYADGGDDDSVNGVATWLILADFGARDGDAGQVTTRLNDALKRRGVRHLTGIIVQTPSPLWQQVAKDVQARIPTHRLWLADDEYGCVAGQAWQGRGIHIQALTGWPGLDDGLTGCSVQIDTDITPSFVGMLHTPSATISDAHSHRTIINGVRDERAWQLYLMLCDTATPLHADSWLSHLRSPAPSAVVSQFAPTGLYYLNHDTPANRQAMLMRAPVTTPSE